MVLQGHSVEDFAMSVKHGPIAPKRSASMAGRVAVKLASSSELVGSKSSIPESDAPPDRNGADRVGVSSDPLVSRDLDSRATTMVIA